MQKVYTTTKELTGFDPNGPNYPDDGSIKIPIGTILLGTENFDEYSIEFIIYEGGKPVCLSRERVCNDVGDPNYYSNYFSLPEGLITLSTTVHYT